MTAKKKIEIQNLPIGDDLKYARRLTRNEFESICHKYMFMNLNDLQKAVNNPNVPVIDMMVLSLMNRGIKEGDQKCMEFLLDRMIGSVVRKIRVQYEDEIPETKAPVEINYQEKMEMLDKLRDIYAKKAEQSNAIIDVESKKND